MFHEIQCLQMVYIDVQNERSVCLSFEFQPFLIYKFMQELLEVIHNRLKQIHCLKNLLPQNSLLNTSCWQFQFNQTLRNDRQIKVLSSLKVQPQTFTNTELQKECREAAIEYKTLCRELDLNIYETLYDEAQSGSSIKVLFVTQFREKMNKICGLSVLDLINKFSNNFGQLLKTYADRRGLQDQIAQLAQKDNKSIPQIFHQSIKANTKIINESKKYYESYRNYGQKMYKRRVKTLALSSDRPKQAQIIERRQIRKILPQNKNINIANIIKNKQIEKSKVLFPSSNKKIQFPHIYNPKHQSGTFLRVFRKQSTKKVITLPHDEINRISFKLENEMCSQSKRGKLKTFIGSQIQSFKTSNKNLRERLLSRKERARFETTFCFDDTFVKKGVDQRLLASDKGIY